MKCILCGLKFDDKPELEKHYIHFHNVNPKNSFYKKLLSIIDNNYLFQKCLRCSELLPTTKFKAAHEFLVHYNEGNNQLAEEKPIDIEENDIFVKYSIDVKKFSDSYNFYNSQSVITDFLNNVRSKIKISNTAVIKGSFVIENIQKASDNSILLKDTRYWSTEVYTVNYFNQFVYYNLAEDYSKRVILNGLSGSSWTFNRFINLNLTLIKSSTVLV